MVLEDERISNIAAIKNLEQIIAADNIGRSTLYEQQVFISNNPIMYHAALDWHVCILLRRYTA